MDYLKSMKMKELNLNKLTLWVIACLFLTLSLNADWYDITQTGLKKREPKTSTEKKLSLPKAMVKEIPLDDPILKDKKISTGTMSIFHINLDLTGFNAETAKSNGEEYQIIALPGCGEQPEVGKPGLPIKNILIPIPDVTIIKLEKIKTKASKKEAGSLDNILVWPTQPANPESGKKPPFQKDESFYKENRDFPDNNVLDSKIVQIRNRSFLLLTVTPFQYNPKKQELKIANSIEFEVVLLSNTENNGVDPDPTQDEYQTFSVNRSELASGLVTEERAALKKYMILMDDQFAQNAKLLEFIEWKKKKGLKVIVVKTSQIPAVVKGAPKATEIVSYMRSLSSANYPYYLLIIGNADETNGVAATPFKTLDGGYSDLEMACRTSTDYLPDLYLGRIPAANNTQLTTMLDKVLTMDRYPGKSNVYGKVLVAGQLQDEDPQDNVCDRYFCETLDLISTYFENCEYPCTITRAITNPNGANAQCLWNSNSMLWLGATGTDRQIGTRVYNTFVSNATAINRILSTVNNGVALVQHRDHGYNLGWGEPSFESSHVKTLTNGINRPAVLTFNCITAAYFNEDNFAVNWLNHPTGGAYAVLGAVDMSYSGYNDWLTHGCFISSTPDYRYYQNTATSPNWTSDLPEPSLFTDWEGKRLGQTLNNGKLYMFERKGDSAYTKTTFQLFDLLGDPETLLRLQRPLSLTVKHPASVCTGLKTITVYVDEPDSLVCLYNKRLGIQIAQMATNYSTCFNVYLNPTAVNEQIAVTVLNDECTPYEGSILVTAFGAPWLSTTQSMGIPGDVDGNNTVDISDALKVVQYTMGLKPENFNISVSDVNKDGTIDVLDALEIARLSVGLTNP